MRKSRKGSGSKVRIALAMLAMLGGLVGCGTRPGAIFPPLAQPLTWPPAPDPARIAYVGQLATSEDLKPGVSGGAAFQRAVFGKEPGHSMLTPFAACTDGDQRLFVADSNAQFVHVFDLKNRKYGQIRPGKGQPPLSQPVAILYDPGQAGNAGARLLVSDSVGGSVFVFRPTDGAYLGQIGNGRLNRPCGLALDPRNGWLYVADVVDCQVVVFDSQGKEVKRIGQAGTGLGEFNRPTYLALDHQGRLYVSDSLNFRVQQFSPGPEHKPVRRIGRKGDMPGYFAQPKGLAVDSEDHLYVVDAQFENVQIFDDQGRILMDFGQEGHGPGQFWLPVSVFIDPRDRIWITDTYNRRVQVFDYKPYKGPYEEPPAGTAPATGAATEPTLKPEDIGPVVGPATRRATSTTGAASQPGSSSRPESQP